jgi:hypothetical protein
MRRMALLHRAELNPSKVELITTWLPKQPWYTGPAEPRLTRIASFRFDDPDGEVGVEVTLLRAADGPVLQVPMTYRATPLDGAEAFLVGYSEHSVLGPRWIYDAAGDPVYAHVLAETIRTGGTQAEEYVDIDGTPERRDPQMTVQGSGTDRPGPAPTITGVDQSDPTVIRTDAGELVVLRVVDDASSAESGGLQLTGVWPGQDTPAALAYLRQPNVNE